MATPAIERSLEALAAAAPAVDTAALRRRALETPIHVRVAMPPADPGRRERAIQAQVLLNLLPRMFGNVSCSGIDPQKVFAPVTGHAKLIRPLAAPPAGAIVVDLTDDLQPYDGRRIYVDHRGWTAYLSSKEPCPAPSGAFNAVGAYFAGTLGVADVFNHLFHDAFPRAEPVQGTWTYDLVTLNENQPANFEPQVAEAVLDLPNVGIVGLGSIGQAVVDILANLPNLTGTVELIDQETTDAGNESRYVLSYPNTRNSFKVLIARDRLVQAHPFLRIDTNGPFLMKATVAQDLVINELGGFRVMEHRETGLPFSVPATTYEVYYDRYRRDRPFDIVIAAVDSEQTRRNIQFGLPRLILNGWTDTASGRLGYAVGRHRVDGDQACLACIYHPEKRDHEPTTEEFIRDLTGWTLEEVNARLGPAGPATSAQDVASIARRRGLPPAQLAALMGKPLAEVLHMPGCGLAVLGGTDRETEAQVFHVPALAACHLVTQLVLEILGTPSPLNAVGYFDANLLPTHHATDAPRPKNPACFCGDPEVQKVYESSWGASGDTTKAGMPPSNP